MTLDEYLQRRYPMVVVACEEGGYFGYFPDLPGCLSQGETVAELAENLEDARRLWLEVCLEDGVGIPPPTDLSTRVWRLRASDE